MGLTIFFDALRILQAAEQFFCRGFKNHRDQGALRDMAGSTTWLHASSSRGAFLHRAFVITHLIERPFPETRVGCLPNEVVQNPSVRIVETGADHGNIGNR
jgi:hypothetical protein